MSLGQRVPERDVQGRFVSQPQHVIVDNPVHKRRESLGMARLWSLFLGFCGGCYYLGMPDKCPLYAFTVGIVGLGWMVDVVRLPSQVRRVDERSI